MLSENNQMVTENVLAFFRRTAPQAYEQVADFIPRLFQALADGHSFIYVQAHEAEQLAQAEPIVGRFDDSPLILHENKRLFLGKFFHLEHQLAHEIQRLSAPIPVPNTPDIAEKLHQWFDDEFSRDQKNATALTLLNSFILINGGPGTGKTTTVAKLLALICDEAQPRIALSAPTGKASARMTQALKNAVAKIPQLSENTRNFLEQLEGQTVHRLLGLQPPQMSPEYNEHNRLPIDILVIDEASMLDMYLFYQLLNALPEHCRVILLGDENQLPSVSAGAVLSALVQSNRPLPEEKKAILKQWIPDFSAHNHNLGDRVAKLTISHRFGENSGIGCLARAIISSSSISMAWAQFERFPNDLEQRVLNMNEHAKILFQKHQAYWQAIEQQDIQKAFEHQADVMVLCANRADVSAFNQAYLNILKQKNRLNIQPLWFAGQILMISRNDPATQLFNGDVGIVMQHPESTHLVAYLPENQGKFRYVALSRLPEHETAFAMTVHKSQGSEYEEVWLLPPQTQETEQSNTGLSRALLYTAVTRAKARFVYGGSEASFQMACENTATRRTLLSHLLK